MKDNITIPYTICFCIHEDEVLMIYRNRPPNQFKWNGIGGKIEKDEEPLKAVYREVMEEAGLDLSTADKLIYGGIVYWEIGNESTNANRGIYTFLAYFAPRSIPWHSKEINEGILEWKPISWVCNPQNYEEVDNIPRFFPDMLKFKQPKEFFCWYLNGTLKKIITKQLSPQFQIAQ